MKTRNIIKGALAFVALVYASAGIARAGRNIYNTTLANESALAYNNTYTVDLQGVGAPGGTIDQLSFQVLYTSATVSAATFNDGAASTGSITVSSYTALIGAKGTNTITVSSNTVLSGQKFTLAGIDFVEGDLWAKQALSSNTAVSITNALNGYGGTNTAFSASTTAATVVTITCLSSGTYCNSFTLTTSTPAALVAGGATFSGGVNDAFLTIAGVKLQGGTDWIASKTASDTAKSISNSIQGNSTLSAIISSTWTSAGVVTATSTAVGSGTNYGWNSSSNTSNGALTCTNGRLFGGTDSNIVTASSQINKSSHGLTTGLQVLYTKTAASTSPANLVANTTYYAIKIDASNFKLASSLANATAGTAISVSTQNATGGGSFTLTPLVIAGTPSFKWQVSNDNSTWTDYTANTFNVTVSSVTMSAYTLNGASTVWDFGPIDYRYIRLNVVAPTAGGILLQATGNGKSN